MTTANAATAGRLLAWRRLAAIALIVACIGLPINHPAGYALLLASALLIFTGEVPSRWKLWAAAVAVVIAAVAGQVLLAPPRIEEGHNVFLVGAQKSGLEAGLPSDAYRLMADEFSAQYPPGRRRAGRPPEQPFAFSADGIFDRSLYSRRVSEIDFSDPVWLRLGFINDSRYNWDDSSDLRRLSRDPRFWMGFSRWQLLMPWFVMYQIPAAFTDGKLCWRGLVLWEEAGERFRALRQPDLACRILQPGDAGRRIFGVAIRPNSLAMTLQPPVSIHVRQWMQTIFMLAGVAGAIALLVRWRSRRLILPLALTGAALLVTAIDDASFIGGWRPYDAGDDGLVYESWGRQIAQYLLQGDIARALEGGEKVYYYGGPGLRYFRALERFIFGDTNFGYLSLILLLPFACLAVFRRFLPPRWALALIVVFMLIPVGGLFGSTFAHYAKWAARGFADPAAVTLFLCGLLPIVGFTRDGPSRRFWLAFGGALLLALAVFVRPNLAPVTGVLLGAAGLAALYQRQWTRLAGMCIGFTPIFSMALHNWYFGGVFVPFSSNATISQLLVMPPQAWALALWDLVRLHWDGEYLSRAAMQIARWLSGPAQLPALIPLHVLGIVVLADVVFRGKNFDPWLRVLATATLVQHLVSLCYAIGPRYFFLTWLLTLVVDVAWLQTRGLPLARHWMPGWYRRMAAHPVRTRIAGWLEWLQDISGPSGTERRASPA